jgi:hypothetical protein
MGCEVDPIRFIANLRFVAGDIRKRGVRDIRIECGDERLNAGWQQDDGCAGSEESLNLANELEALALRMEFFGINNVTLMQTNEAETQSNGRTRFTGKRSLSANWKWNKGVNRGTTI